MSQQSKPREFWISMCTFNDGYTEIYECRDAEFNPCPPAEKVHVVEKSALDRANEKLAATEAMLEKALEALKFYGNYMNYSIDYDTSNNGFSRRCILYSDIEERNEVSGLAGMRARKAIKEIEAMREK